MKTLLEGSVVIAKRLLGHPVSQRVDYLGAWVTLLALANDRDRSILLLGKRVEVKRGQLAWSLSALQKQIGKGRKWFLTFLEFCKEEDMVTVQIHAHGAIITILNYDAYNSHLPDLKDNTKAHDKDNGITDVKANGMDNGLDNEKEQQNRELRKGKDVPPSDIGEVPEESEIEAYCKSFTDLSRGITAGIPEVWWRGWLSIALSRSRFPVKWKEVLKQAFIGDFINRHPKALGLVKNAAPGAASGTPRREQGELLQLIKLAMDSGDAAEEKALRAEYANYYGGAS